MGAPEARRCLFCLGPLARGRSKEHIFPQWLLDELGIRETVITPTEFKPDGTVVESRQHPLKALLEGRVCGDCNTGWMSRLEERAKPILVGLFRLTREVAELSWVERDIVARWAVKTALVLNSASNYFKAVPQDHYSSLRAGTDVLPAGVYVLGQQHHGTESFYWLQGAIWTGLNVPESSRAEMARLAEESYKVSLQFQKLLLIVAYWPHGGWRLAIRRGIHVPLWPHRGPVASLRDNS